MACILHDVRVPFFHNVFEGIVVVDAEAEEDYVGIGIAEGSQTVKVFLACCVPEGEFDEGVLRAEADVLDEGVEDRGDMVSWAFSLLKDSNNAISTPCLEVWQKRHCSGGD